MDAQRSAGPLAGVRVLDLSRILSGPFATMVFADLGADVIKLENPRTGDDTRQWAPPYQGDQSAYFLSVNRNKRGVAVDLKTEQGLDIALRLADRADIVVENFRPGTAGRLGLGYDALAARNPRLIYASISGFGQTGPYASRAGLRRHRPGARRPDERDRRGRRQPGARRQLRRRSRRRDGGRRSASSRPSTPATPPAAASGSTSRCSTARSLR